MAEKQFIATLKPDQTVTDVFWVRSKELRNNRNGKPYLYLQVCDRTGQMSAFMWNNFNEVAAAFQRDDFVEIKGTIQQFQNQLQLNIHKLSKTDASAVQMSDYLPVSVRDPEEMFRAVCGHIEQIGNPALKGLLESIFLDEQIASAFKRAPAAKNLHHAFLGGLIEHTLSLVELCRHVAAQYGGVNVDLLVAGALLHDLGKIVELDFKGPFAYTNEGNLLGHIAIGLNMVADRIGRLPGFPEETRLQLLHLLASHHGKVEHGSPRPPATLEAVLLHQLDMLDSRAGAFQQASAHCTGEWTAYSALFERALYVKKLE